jgi:uncharacterized protein YeeX (DUF496 family)
MPHKQMNQTIKIILALQQVEGISKLMKGNEYESYIISYLVPIHAELNRQLTNSKQSTKMKK